MEMKRIWMVPAVALLAACSTVSAVSGWFKGGETVEVVEVGRSQTCGSTGGSEPRLRLFASASAANGWQQITGMQLKLTEDLKPGMYASIEMGQRSTGGYGIAVSRDGKLVDGRLQLFATFFSPAPGSMRTQMITSPCVLVRLPDVEFSVVEVYDQDGELRASSATGE
jgi:hypothetical protein